MDDVKRLANLFLAIDEFTFSYEPTDEETREWYAKHGDEFDESMGMTPNEAVKKIDKFTKDLIQKHRERKKYHKAEDLLNETDNLLTKLRGTALQAAAKKVQAGERGIDEFDVQTQQDIIDCINKNKET